MALDLRPPDAKPEAGSGPVVRRSRLHGLINEYYRAA